jgi:formate-dependent nitrite reductase membrane component NrfD
MMSHDGRADGRNIDPKVGALGGEGGEQRAAGSQPPPETELSSIPPSQSGDNTYYGRPVIKEPVWIWAVPAYFYAGGAAGAAATLGGVAQLVDADGMEDLITRCRRIAAVGTMAGTALLIYDLGRPERFLNMLRVFRPTSPMSVGSWLLAAATPLAAASAALGRSTPGRRTIADAAGLAAGIAAGPLTGYTAVLLTNTVVPIWSSVRRTLPALFVASSMSSALSLLEATALNERERSVVGRLGLLSGGAELLATFAVEREAGRVEGVERPLKTGVAGKLWNTATACTVAGLVLSLLPGNPRPKVIASSAIGTIGSIATRFALFFAGRGSARDPQATFDTQRGTARTLD